jgi:hypothetical protein
MPRGFFSRCAADKEQKAEAARRGWAAVPSWQRTEHARNASLARWTAKQGEGTHPSRRPENAAQPPSQGQDGAFHGDA